MKINIIAEIGWNFMGDLTLAKKMISSASKSGADTCNSILESSKLKTW